MEEYGRTEKAQEVVGLFKITTMVKNTIIHPSRADGIVIQIKGKHLQEKLQRLGFELNLGNKYHFTMIMINI